MKLSALLLLVTGAMLVGCAGRTEMIPNDNPALRKTPAEFAADAAKRHPYKSDAERGGQAKAHAEVEYVWDRIRIVNTGDAEWTDIEVWVNGQYVVFLPRLSPKKLESAPFQALFNDKGQSFPTSNGKWLNREPIVVKKVEIFRDGKLYDVPLSVAD